MPRTKSKVAKVSTRYRKGISGELMPVATRSGYCATHDKRTTSFCGTNKAEADGLERWVFFCKGESEQAGPNEGHYFANRAPFNA